jgi:septal ring factor EnvC (AmiA/AmiB activator)
MPKFLFSTLLFSVFLFCANIHAQTREELEKQRQQLKKEIEETESQLNDNKLRTKENMYQYNLILKKVNLQNSVLDNINRDLNRLDDNMYLISRDINRYDKLLDTLKQEYAKSMVYAYKNRSSLDFLNFIFSASNFNDAMKRISYLKSYREYREMQGENISRTQDLRKKRITDLNGAKKEKSQVLQVQSKEMAVLETQQKEKDRVLAELKKQGKQLTKQIAAKQKQMQKVTNAIAAAIKRAQEEARKAALAKTSNIKSTGETVKTNTKITTNKPSAPKESILLNDENIALNNSFEKNKGSLPWPVDRGSIIMHYGQNTLGSGTVMNVTSTTIASDVGTSVKAVFEGNVSSVIQVEDMTVVIIQHGRYFSTYSNLKNVSVQKGQKVTTGQVIGKVATNLDGMGAIDFYIQNETSNYDPEKWLRRK